MNQPAKPAEGITILYSLTDPAHPEVRFITLDYIPRPEEMMDEIRMAIELPPPSRGFKGFSERPFTLSEGPRPVLIESQYKILGYLTSDPRLCLEVFEPTPNETTDEAVALAQRFGLLPSSLDGTDDDPEE